MFDLFSNSESKNKNVILFALLKHKGLLNDNEISWIEGVSTSGVLDTSSFTDPHFLKLMSDISYPSFLEAQRSCIKCPKCSKVGLKVIPFGVKCRHCDERIKFDKDTVPEIDEETLTEYYKKWGIDLNEEVSEDGKDI